MSTATIRLNDATYGYLLKVSLREHPVLCQLREYTARLPEANMQIAPEQGQFMALLARLIGARKAIEVGTFTGYSTLAVALALPEDGKLLACDVSERWTATAQEYWRRAGVAERIELHLAPALQTLDALLAEGQAGHFDFAFIDADKRNYVNYYERILRLLRPGGLVAVDNVLWGGQVADPAEDADDTVAIRAFNAHVREDDRVDLSLVPIGDGLTLARKRE